MGIDPNLLSKEVPQKAAMYNQVTSTQSVRAFIATALTLVLCFQALTGQSIDPTLLALASGMIGFYFGVDVPTSNKAKDAKRDL